MPGRRAIDSGSKFLNWILAKEIRQEKLNRIRKQRNKDISPSLLYQGGGKRKKKSWQQVKRLLEMNGQLNRRRGSGRKGVRRRAGGKSRRRGGKSRPRGGKKRKRRIGGRRGRKRRAGLKRRKRAGAVRKKAGAARKRAGKRGGRKLRGGRSRKRRKMHPRMERGAAIQPLQTKAVQLAHPQRTLASRQFSLQKKVGLQPMSSLDIYRDRL